MYLKCRHQNWTMLFDSKIATGALADELENDSPERIDSFPTRHTYDRRSTHHDELQAKPHFRMAFPFETRGSASPRLPVDPSPSTMHDAR